MDLPFTADQFFGLFAAYNNTVFPAQFVLLALGLGAAWLSFRAGGRSERVVGAMLAGLWLWMGVVYHWVFFAALNPAARVFGAAFVVEGLALAWFLTIRSRVRLRAERTWRGGLGLAILIYAFMVYPALGWALGHRYPSMPTFGLPCPTTIATLGMLLWAVRRPPLAVMIVPWLWALVGTGAAIELGAGEDLGLSVAAVVSLLGWVVGYRRPAAARSSYPVPATPSSPSSTRSS